VSNNCFPLVRGRVMRATALDGCGRPKAGACGSVTTDGFVSVAFTANTDEGEEISVTNASGKVCVRDAACPTLTGYTAVITFCAVNPELYAMLTGQAAVYDWQGNAVGFRVNSDRSACDYGFALELWSNVPQVACDPDNPDAQGTYGYILVPFMQGGTLGDFTIENAAVSFTINGAATKTGSGWGVGPYDVVRGSGGTAGPLLEPILSGDHLHVQLTDVAPPEAACDCISSGVPATGATAGTPGTWTPVDSYAPQSIAGMTGVTASPNTAWTSGQYVLLGNNQRAHWNGTAWASDSAVMAADSDEDDEATAKTRSKKEPADASA
jgi:hypothetical protein